MTNAYNFMSSVTGTERRKLKEVFVNLFEFYPVKFTDFTIAPLKYIEDVPVNKPVV
jgi:hypothetical protein